MRENVQIHVPWTCLPQDFPTVHYLRIYRSSASPWCLVGLPSLSLTTEGSWLYLSSALWRQVHQICRKIWGEGQSDQLQRSPLKTLNRFWLPASLWFCDFSQQSRFTTACRSVEGLVLPSDVVLETRVMVSRRLEDKNESLCLGLGLELLVLVLVLKKKSCSFSRLLL